jgi:TPR repeat protein
MAIQILGHHRFKPISTLFSSLNSLSDNRPSFLARAVAVLTISLQLGCASQMNADRDATIKAIQNATQNHDYVTAYELALPLAEKGDAEIQYSLAKVTYPYIGLLPRSEIQSATYNHYTIWLRRSAYGGWSPALMEMATNYSEGTTDFPKDPSMSKCFRAVYFRKARLATCQSEEVAKKYIVQILPLSHCGDCGDHPDSAL